LDATGSRLSSVAPETAVTALGNSALRKCDGGFAGRVATSTAYGRLYVAQRLYEQRPHHG
jgi:hypothetical protein